MTKKENTNTEDIFSEQNIQCPYHLHNRIREEHAEQGIPAKIIWNTHINGWLVLDVELQEKIALASDVFSSVNSIYGSQVPEMPEDVQPLLTIDGEKHRYKRKIIKDAFKTDEVEYWEPVARKLTISLLEKIVATGQQRNEIMKELAIPLPIKIICEVMGLEYDDQKIQYIKEQTDAAVSFLGHVANDRFTEKERKFDAENRTEIPLFILTEMENKKLNPDDYLLSRVLASEFNAEGINYKPSDIELIADVCFLLFAGNITTTNLIGQCFKYLALDAELQKNVVNNNALIPELVEEVLRLEAPIQGTYRKALKDLEMDGISISKGELLYLSWGAAGRDPQRHACPHQFDINRNDKSHLAFGKGVHYCLGANLARMEARVALEETFNYLSHFQLPQGYEIEYIDMPLFRGPKELEVEYYVK